MAAGDPRRLTSLLDANSVEARLVALTRVPDADLSDEALGVLLTDRAQHGCASRHVGAPADAESTLPPTTAASSGDLKGRRESVRHVLDGLAVVGDESDLQTCTAHLAHESARVRAAAVNAVLGRAGRGAVVELLVPVLLDTSARVSATAARALARLSVPASAAETAWRSAEPSTRRAAWWLSRASGGWHRVEADLRAAADLDEHLASLGRAGVTNWLIVSAATTWDRLPEEQMARIAELLRAATLDDNRRSMVEFHAGIKPPAPEAGPDKAVAEQGTTKQRWWLHAPYDGADLLACVVERVPQ